MATHCLDEAARPGDRAGVIALVLQFIAGVYLGFPQFPKWLRTAASAFPLKWMAQGMRFVFLPGGSQGSTLPMRAPRKSSGRGERIPADGRAARGNPCRGQVGGSGSHRAMESGLA